MNACSARDCARRMGRRHALKINKSQEHVPHLDAIAVIQLHRRSIWLQPESGDHCAVATDVADEIPVPLATDFEMPAADAHVGTGDVRSTKYPRVLIGQ